MTILNRIAMHCIDNPSHPMFKETDGARCVVCNSLVTIKPITEAQYHALSSYSELCKKRKTKHSNIQRGRFLSALQGIELGKLIAEEFAKGLEDKQKHLESSE